MATNFHVRSISLPSESHPLAASVEEQFRRLRASQETSTSSSDLLHKLDSLRMLYECIDDFLQLPTQQNLSNGNLDEVLNGSIRILDICDVSRDALSQMKECLQKLESSIRRRSGDDNEMISSYMAARKKISKVSCKSLKNLKRSETKRVNSDQDPAIKMLSEAEAISLKVFESLFSVLISQSKTNNGWSSVSKLLKPKRVSCESLLRESEDLNSTIQELEQNLECLYRRLVKTRVSILSLLNN